MDKENIEKIGEMYSRMYTRLHKLAYRHIHDRHIAEDIVNDTFMEAMKHQIWWCAQKRSLQEKYLMETCVRLCNAHMQKEERCYYLSYDDEKSEEPGSDRCIETVELRESLVKCMEHLGEDERQVIGKKYFGNYSTGQLSAHIGISKANVLQRLVRARRKLKTILDEHGIEGPD